MSSRPFGHRGQHGHTLLSDVHEPAVDGDPVDGAVLLLEAHQSGHDGADQRRVAGKEGGLAHVGTQHDGVTSVSSDHVLGGDEAGRQRWPRLLGSRLELLGLLEHRVHAAHVQERLLGHVVEVAVDQGLEGLDRLLDRHVDARRCR